MKPQYPLVISTLAQRFAMGAYCFGLIAKYLFGLDVNMSLLALIALVVLALGMLASTTHLGKPGRILNTFANPSSHLTKEMFCVPFVGIAYLLVGLNGYAYTLPQEVLSIVEFIGLAASVAFIWVTAFAYLMPARPAWRTIGTPVTFLLTFLSAGAIGAAAFMACTGVEVSTSYLVMTLILFIIALIGQGLFIYSMGHVGFGADVSPFEEYIRPTFLAWVGIGAILATLLAAVEIAIPTSGMIGVTFAVYVIGLFIWQCFFFMCGKDVQFFPQYADAPMNPDFF